jgi:hypothetical protein
VDKAGGVHGPDFRISRAINSLVNAIADMIFPGNLMVQTIIDIKETGMKKRDFIAGLLLLPPWALHAQTVGRQSAPCPKTKAFGKSSDPNVIRARSAAGEWEMRFDSAVLVIEDYSFKIVLPRINDYEWIVLADGEALGSGPGPYPVVLSGQWSLAGCPPISRDVLDVRLKGQLKFTKLPASGDGENCAFSFQLTVSDSSKQGISGEINRATALSIRNRDTAKIKGSFTSETGARVKVTSGVIVFYPDSELLEVSLNHDHSSGGTGRSVVVEGFRGTPGVYLSERSETISGRDRRVMVIYQITEFSGKRLAGRTLWAPLELAQRPGTPPEELLKHGKELSVFETNDLVTVRYPVPIKMS